MYEIVAKAAIEKAVELVAARLANGIRLTARETAVAQVRRTDDAVREHLTILSRWAADVSFRELWKSKSLSSSFVDLDLHLGTRRERVEANEESPLRVSDLVDHRGHVVLLGDPGAGKTTSLKRVAAKSLERISNGSDGQVPVLIRLREFAESDTLFGAIIAHLGIHIQFREPERERQFRKKLEQRLVAQAIEEIPFYFLIDGLDEIHPAARLSVIEDLRYLLLRLDESRVVLTCRIADYQYHLERSKVYTLESLRSPQVQQFAIRWLGKDRAPEFLTKIRDNPYAGTEIKPLTLAHLCAIYERTGTVPEKPKTIYRKIVRLLLEEWDEQRSVRRFSRYPNFETDQKEEFLEAIAYELTVSAHRSSFSEADLRNAYAKTYQKFRLPHEELAKVMREIESHSGLLLESAYEQYEFAHKSIQEYLTASYILKLPSIPADLSFGIPNEMALAVALSSDPTGYLATVIFGIVAKQRSSMQSFSVPFVQRLLVEKAEFVFSPRLGILLTLLYSETYYPENQIPEVEALDTRLEILPFYAHSQLRDSVVEALKQCNVSWQSELARVRVPHSLAGIPIFRSDRVQGAFEVTVDTAFFDSIGYLEQEHEH